MDQAVEALLNKLKEKSLDIYEHSQRVKNLAEKFADELDIAKEEKENLVLAAVLHDIGMLDISEDLIDKDKRLSLDEYEKIKEHPVLGENLVADLPNAKEIQPLIRHHHENYNGFGYPDEIEKDQIPASARILHIIEAYDSMSNVRSFQKIKRNSVTVLNEIKNFAGRIYDPDYVKKFIAFIEKTTQDNPET